MVELYLSLLKLLSLLLLNRGAPIWASDEWLPSVQSNFNNIILKKIFRSGSGSGQPLKVRSWM